MAFVLDGKSFAEDEMVVALGVTTKGDKVFLGFVQTDTENAVVIRSFLRSLKDRGLDLSAGALVVIDGARGLRSGVLVVFKGQVLIQRCQWHKRENVISYLPRAEQKGWRQRLQRAYQRPTYEEAVQDLEALRQELAGVNQSAAASLDEGFEETLRSSPELCVKVRGSSSMLRLGCLGDLLRFEKREIEVTALAPDRSSPQSNGGDEAECTGSVGEGAGAPDSTLDLGVQALEAVRGA